MYRQLTTVDLNLLVTLDAVLAECSVSQAANRLRVTQSAVSHALKRLREIFSDPLVIRKGAGVTPTPRGLALQEPTRTLLAQARAILDTSPAFDPATSTRKFRISMSDAMSVEALPLILQQLRRQAPGIDLTISTSGPRQSCEWVRADEVDMAIGVYPRLLPGLHSRELYRDTLVCVADRNNKRLKNGRLDFACSIHGVPLSGQMKFFLYRDVNYRSAETALSNTSARIIACGIRVHSTT